MINSSLLYFKGPKKLIDFIHQFEVYKNWKIQNGIMNDRGYDAQDSDFFIQMTKLFADKEMFHRKVSIAELTTWLDSFVHLERLCNLLLANLSMDILDEIEIAFEYIVEMSKKSRVDVIFKYRNRYCLFEFTTVNSFGRIKTAFDKKRLELIIYKDMMQNYIDYPSKLICYPFVGLHEYVGDHRRDSFYENNIKNISYAYEYLKKFLFVQ